MFEDLQFHPHMLIDIEPTLGKREPINPEVEKMLREVIETARKRAQDERNK